MALRVLHLVGSAMNDFYCDLSRLYATDCLAATNDPDRYEVHLAYVTPDGRWRFPADLSAATIAAAPTLPIAAAVARLADLHLDVAVPQMFCLPGMTTYRSLLDLIGVPFVGSTAEVMALGANKARARAIVADRGVNVPAGELLRPGQLPTIRPPAVVKPVDADNSLGISLVRQEAEYDSALAAAFAHSDEAIVESYVELGREVRCGVIVRDGELLALPLEEYAMDPQTKPVRDAADKIARDGDDLRLVAKDDQHAWIVDPADPITADVWDAARRCHAAIGARHYSLFDFRIDAAGRPWFLEAGLYCSFAKQSVVSVMAAAAGIDVPELFAGAVAQAVAAGPG